MNILIVIAIHGYMASVVRSAPLPELPGANRTLVADPAFQEVLLRSLSLIQKVLLSISETHKSCIHTETLQLNSTENANLKTMEDTIRFPSAPVVKAISESFTLETSLRRMSEGLQLHQDLLKSVLPQLDNKDCVTELLADIRDLLIQIHKMLRKVQAEPGVQPTASTLALRLQGEFQVQVATHLTLVQLQSFVQDMARCLRSLVQEGEQS
ncbi:colony stimulating factor 3 (granulocyte) a isoform X2 [Centroberyx gerrardi]